jgi:predicted RNase H-like HicB family nuclease
MTRQSYSYVVERADDGGYWAYLPDLPGCTTAGDSVEEVEKRLPEAVDLYLTYYRERGLPAPCPESRVGTLPAA